MNKEIKKRSEADPAFFWNTGHLFETDKKWEEEWNLVSAQMPDIVKWKGRLDESADTLFRCLQECDEISMRLEKLYIYANLKFHEDSENTFYQTLSQKSEMLMVEYASQTSFLVPELLEIDDTTLNSFLTALNGIKVYEHFIENLRRKKKHTLSQPEEEILAKASEIADSPHQIFVMINDADLRFPLIKDENGEQTELTKGRYTVFLQSKDRRVRKEAFDTLYDTYEKQKNTLAAAYYASVKKDNFYARVRKYPSALAEALFDDYIPLKVYDTLIDTVHRHLPLLHRYIELRKRILGVEELHMYDLYAPLVPDLEEKNSDEKEQKTGLRALADGNWNISYEKAKETVLKGLAPLGKVYQDKLVEGFSGGWIDVYENKGKRGGAYSWGAFPGHPYVLLNHNDTINSMFTLAHEMGHALHSAFTWEKQPYPYAGHKIFVAEVASTVNEALLMEYLLENTEDKKEKAYLINYFMEQFRGTLFRQTMFAEFEKKTHEMAEQGEPLTCERLMKLYHELNVLYFGKEIVVDEKIDLEWARIPHFYNAFYVYQYATGYSAAISLSRKILSEGQPAVERYLDFLSKGNSEYSIDLLKGAGVDMTTAEPMEKAMQVFEGLLDQMEAFILE